MEVQILENDDTFHWNLSESGLFTVKSMYLDLLDGNAGDAKKIWKIKVPLKIRIFMWFLHKKVILTKYNLKKTIGMDVPNVASVIKMKQFNIYSLPTLLLNTLVYYLYDFQYSCYVKYG
jgi:hypothetical protein